MLEVDHARTTDVHKSVSPDQLSAAVSAVNQALAQAQSQLELSIDPATGIHVAKLVDAATGELIRQIPSDQVLAIAQAIDRGRQGLLMDQLA